MGVPALFGWLARTFPEALVDACPCDCSYLYLDWNGGIHTACRDVLSARPQGSGDDETLEDDMLRAVTRRLDATLARVPADADVYLAIDGVAPRAKLNQQRTRRYKAHRDREVTDAIRRRHGLAFQHCGWDTNAISCGTRFMDELASRVEGHLHQLARNATVHYSPPHAPSEGEHKLIERVRANAARPGAHVIEGLDADLIFLCLLCDPAQAIFIMRETAPDQVRYLDVRRLRTALMRRACLPTDDSDAARRFSRDFTILCMLFGNDFLPRVPSLYIEWNMIAVVLRSYASSNASRDGLVRADASVDFGALCAILQPLLANESGRLRKRRAQLEYASPPAMADACEKELYEYEHVFPRRDDIVRHGAPEWRMRYNQSYLHPEGHGDVARSVQRACMQYACGIEWVLSYYQGRLRSWTWSYGADHAPTLADLLRHLPRHAPSKHKWTLGLPAPPLLQLMMVVPPSSAHLLPKPLRALIHNELAHLYPHHFEEDDVMKHRRHLTVAKLPRIDQRLMWQFFQKAALDVHDAARNKHAAVVWKHIPQTCSL